MLSVPEIILKLTVDRDRNYVLNDLELRSQAQQYLQVNLQHRIMTISNMCPVTLPPGVKKNVEQIFGTKDESIDYIIQRTEFKGQKESTETHMLRRYPPTSDPLSL